MIGLGGALKFLRNVATRDAGIVGGQGDRYAELKIYRKRMMVAGYVENHIIAGEADFDQNILVAIQSEEGFWIGSCITSTP